MPKRSPAYPFVLTITALGGCASAPPDVVTGNPPPPIAAEDPSPPAEAAPAVPAPVEVKKPEGVAWTPGLTGETAEHARACDSGDDSSWCMSIGNLYELGPQPDLPRALAVYQLGCDGGDKGACMNVGRMYLDGVGTAADAEKGASLLTRVCEDMKNGEACFRLGERHESGQGVAKDPARSREFYGKACDNNFVNGCKKAGKKGSR